MSASKVPLGTGTEDPAPTAPWVSLLLAYAAMVPIAGGAAACFIVRGQAADLTVHLTILWSGAVLCFLSGVRRGLSFRQAGGASLAQLATMLWLFVLGAGSLLSPSVLASLALQILGYLTMALYDPIAAREEEVPRYFQRLRPVQMLIPIVSLILVAGRLLV